MLQHTNLQHKNIDAECWLQGLLPLSYQSNATQREHMACGGECGHLIETRQNFHHKPKDNCFQICIRQVI